MAVTFAKALTKVFGSRNERMLKRYHRMVDQINAAEGSYRKERILAWSRARKVLNDQQRNELVNAAGHHRHHH